MNKKRHCRGASIIESMFAICIMGLLFFALMQIWTWCNARLFCRYSSYYAVKAKSLGFNNVMVLRAARVAAIPVSGPARRQSRSVSDDATAYMVYGDGSGVSYAYWHPSYKGEPELQVSGQFDGDSIYTNVKLRFMTLLDENFGKIFGIHRAPYPNAVVQMHNYAETYLED